MGAARSVISREELVFIKTPGYQLRSFVEKRNNTGSQDTAFLMKAHHVYFRLKFCPYETGLQYIKDLIDTHQRYKSRLLVILILESYTQGLQPVNKGIKVFIHKKIDCLLHELHKTSKPVADLGEGPAPPYF